MSEGFLLIECNDAKLLAEFALMWSDIMHLRAVAVIEDAELVETLQSSVKPAMRAAVVRVKAGLQ